MTASPESRFDSIVTDAGDSTVTGTGTVTSDSTVTVTGTGTVTGTNTVTADSTVDRIRPVIDWLLAQALTDFSMEALVAGVAERMNAAAYPLYRLQISARLIHPLYAATAITWVRGRGASTGRFEHGGRQSDAWQKSPLRHMLENAIGEYRLRIEAGEGAEYTVAAELRDAGATDYLAMRTPFGATTLADTDPAQVDGTFMTWSCDAPGGWSAADVADLRRLQSRLAVVFRLAMRQRLAEDVVSAYLGADAGRRILAGQIQRGDGEDIDAVIWFSDLRASTRLAEALAQAEFLELLNRFFECTAGAVQAGGGEILGYIGDCVLAIFPFAKFSGAAPACRAALAAGRSAQARLAAVNTARAQAGEAALGFGVGLHPGRVMFGNIGLPERLNFSVIGPAANEAARVADQCGPLGEVIVVSERFRALVGDGGDGDGGIEPRHPRASLSGGGDGGDNGDGDSGDGAGDGDAVPAIKWRALGAFELRNVDQPMRLFAPA